MTSQKPLAGIRVLELGAYISAPYAGSVLCGLGAEVIKIEPVSGDPFRRGMGAESQYFRQYNAGKKSVAVNLKSPDGVALVKKMLPGADVLLENSRPGKSAALGLGAADCQAINPQLIYSEVSGFGDGGPWRDRAAYDTIGQSMGGLYSIMHDEGKADLTGSCIGDLTTALISCMGVLAALVGRERHPDRLGKVTQTSLLEAISTITIDAMSQYHDERKAPTRRSRHPQAQNFCLRTADGSSISMHLSSSEKFWQNFAQSLGLPELTQDPRFASFKAREQNYFDLVAIAEGVFLRHPSSYWEQVLVANDVPYAPVLTMQTLSEHPQYRYLEMQETDAEGRVTVHLPWRFDGARARRSLDVPEIGGHSREIATELLGAAEAERMIAAGVLRQA